jgi:hypothetical protein
MILSKYWSSTIGKIFLTIKEIVGNFMHSLSILGRGSPSIFLKICILFVQDIDKSLFYIGK